MQIDLKIENLAEIKRAHDKAPGLAVMELNKAIRKSILDIQRESMVRTPIDTGRLRASYQTEFSELKGRLSPETNYAVYVHENLRAKHKTGEAKFLEKGAEAAKNKINNYFLEAVKNILNQIAFLAKI